MLGLQLLAKIIFIHDVFNLYWYAYENDKY